MKFWQKLFNRPDRNKTDVSESDYEVKRYRDEGGHIRNLVRDGKNQNSAAFGGMGERELQLRLELLVDQVLSSRRSVFKPAQALAQFSLADQERFLRSVESICTTNVELAYNFCHLGPPALQQLEEYNWQDWIDHILSIYDQKGMIEAILTMQNLDQYLASIQNAPASVDFEEVARILESVMTGLNGRALKLESGDSLYTDTEIIHVPSNISTFKSKQDNFALYKSIAVHQWAQNWFGTWRVNVAEVVSHFTNPEYALQVFHTLETIRLDACIQRELPGLARTMRPMASALYEQSLPDTWQKAIDKLTQPTATVENSVALLEALVPLKVELPTTLYQGILMPDIVARTMQLRAEREKEAFTQAVTDSVNEMTSSPSSTEEDKESVSKRLQTIEVEDDSMPDGYRLQLQLDGRDINPPEEVQQLIESIQQDFGEIPDDYLNAADDQIKQQDPQQSALDPLQTQPQEKVFLYDEWDHSRKKYRKEWCQLREYDVTGAPSSFVENTLQKHRGILKHLHRTFEALREEDRRLHRQPYGEDIDIDALVETYADIIDGREADENIFIKQRKVDRNIAVMFMIDMSGSTAGWINEMEREALVLLCESLEILGDRYSIFGFSGVTHERCDLYRIKSFNEHYNQTVKNRISSIRPQDYTRMGAAIRHLTKLLQQEEAKTKVLITLSDGRPDDRDGYRGPYGIEDTRRALMEAKYLGIHPFCITIDEEAMDYLQHMYGYANFTIVNEVGKLPFKVSDIYHRITH